MDLHHRQRLQWIFIIGSDFISSASSSSQLYFIIFVFVSVAHQVAQHTTTMATSGIISYADLCRTLHSIVRWCRAKSLLPVSRDCECGCSCRVAKRPRYPEGECFRCPRKGCQKQISFRTGTFFENSNLPLEKILRIVHMWSTVTPLNKMRKELDVSCKNHVL